MRMSGFWSVSSAAAGGCSGGGACTSFVFVLLLAVCGHRCSAAQVDVEEVTVLVGGTALLPCDIMPPLPNDSVILVIWFKNDVTPIYTYDIRGKHSELASHWRDRDLLQQRGYFRTITEPASLALEDARAQDDGDYRCRVDFRRSPTRNARVKLSVVVPPQVPVIVDERGRELQTTAGPYPEGASVKLTCIVRGGRPAPTLRWWRGERMLDARGGPAPSFIMGGGGGGGSGAGGGVGGARSSVLQVAPLTRSDLHAVFTCQATNSALVPPASARLTLDMLLRPLGAAIVTARRPLSAGHKVDVECVSAGSRPPASLSWWLDNRALLGSIDKVVGDGNTTTSTLHLTPAAADNGKVLTCRAENPSLPAGVEEDTWRLNVHYGPALRLQLGSNLNPDDIEEGDDVYFECKVHANPWVYKVTWKNNGRELHHNPKGGVLLINHDLALQAVRREQAGNYSCFATNAEGDGESNAVPLRVMFAPVCRGGQRRVYAVARHETVRVRCEVDAFPPPESFRWTFNHSSSSGAEGGAAAAAAGASGPAVTEGGSGAGASGSSAAGAWLAYVPTSEADYGTLLCAAANAAGHQREPCVFHIIPAGRPEAPFNCSLWNASASALEVECAEGFDGGLPQLFQLEVFDWTSGRLLANVTSHRPRFLAQRLPAGRPLSLLAYAANAKGRSEPCALDTVTLHTAQRRTGARGAGSMPLAPLLAALLGALGALLLLAAAAATAVAVRARRAGQLRRPRGLALKEKPAPATRRAGQRTAADGGDPAERDDRNPDVVPCTTDAELQLAETPGPLQVLLPAVASAAAGTMAGAAAGTMARAGAATTAADGSLPDAHVRCAFKGGGIGQGAGVPPGYVHALPPMHVENVQYAELALGHPHGSPYAPTGPYRRMLPPDPTLYVQIDHARRPYPAPPATPSVHEMVLVRQPYVRTSAPQESCV